MVQQHSGMAYERRVACLLACMLACLLAVPARALPLCSWIDTDAELPSPGSTVPA